MSPNQGNAQEQPVDIVRMLCRALEGVVADIGVERSRIDEVLLGEFLGHLAVEWPACWLALPQARTFATRLSNADLAQLMLSLPWTATRFWLEQFAVRERQ